MKIALRMALLALAFLTSISVSAQEVPRAEIFGGYSLNTQGDMAMEVSHGWNASASANLNKWLSAVADFSGYYRTDDGVSQRDFNFLFGPRLTYRGTKFSPFTHVLLGATHERVSRTPVATTDNAFAMAAGGGLDYRLSRFVSVRLAQADYFLNRVGGTSQNSVRLSFGAVLKFGQK